MGKRTGFPVQEPFLGKKVIIHASVLLIMALALLNLSMLLNPGPDLCTGNREAAQFISQANAEIPVAGLSRNRKALSSGLFSIMVRNISKHPVASLGRVSRELRRSDSTDTGDPLREMMQVLICHFHSSRYKDRTFFA